VPHYQGDLTKRAAAVTTVTHIDQHHPEDLLDRALRGQGETRDLREHTKRCKACLVHLTVGRHLADELAPRAEDRQRDERAVLLAASTLARQTRRRRARPIWILAAAAVLSTGAASADLWRARALPPAPVEPPSLEPPRLTRHFAVPLATTPLPRATTSQAVPAEGARTRDEAASASHETAASLFAEANELRRTGRDEQAIRTYRRLQRAFPGTPEADQSFATMGQLLLDRVSSEEALTQFDRYLTQAGPVTEDVLVGRAQALQHLGRRHQERATWEMLLLRFPNSVHAARARARIAELR
jgi:tetratricopeptide (TPR) repeat protein